MTDDRRNGALTNAFIYARLNGIDLYTELDTFVENKKCYLFDYYNFHAKDLKTEPLESPDDFDKTLILEIQKRDSFNNSTQKDSRILLELYRQARDVAYVIDHIHANKAEVLQKRKTKNQSKNNPKI